MKKRILLFVSLALLSAMPLLAQDDSHSNKKILSCTGSISQDGQSFVCEKDHHTWKISNSWGVKDMEGQHAKLTYHLTSAAGEIFVTSAATAQDPTVAKNDPAAPK
jgi:hypothetical protein